MSYCINPYCAKPNDFLDPESNICHHCGSQLQIHNRYRVTRPLGGNSLSQVYEVDDQGIAKVLKVLLINDPKAVSLFQQEAKVLIQAQHPGLPQVAPDGYFTFLPLGSQQPLHCLVMEKIEGISLEKWQQRQQQPLSQAQALKWLKQIVEILDQVHRRLYLHRNIKPSNIMLKPNGQLVLIDFGSAKEIISTYLVKVGGGQEVTGIISPGYTPLEQANGKAVPQSDFFALGRAFVYLFTGKSPNDFLEDPRNGQLLWQHRAAHISQSLADLIDDLMTASPGDRPHNSQRILLRLAIIQQQLRLPQPPEQNLQKGSFPRQNFIINPGRSPSRTKRLVAKYQNVILVTICLLLGLVGSQIYNSWDVISPQLNSVLFNTQDSQ
jgi:serine/threonine protein kinase